uniref:DUF1064 domain-containing protein n=1 Tax=viral metagenome TaxID=1070528 RepID=A0A6M3IN66_9ZZZZ
MNQRSEWEAFIKKKEGRTKYGNKKAVVRGEVLDSKHEAKRYQDLLFLEAAGHITDLKRQVEFHLIVNGWKIASYFADFCYIENAKKIVEDAKGCKTRDYTIKKKLMKALFGIEIKEV